MKKTVLPTISILIAVLIFAAMPTEADAAVYDDTVRLHILAPSDSSEDQALKLEVRDAVLGEFGSSLGACAAEARETLRKSLPQIEALATDIAQKRGYTASAALVREWFDTRTYGDVTLPCGTYHSLTITLGEGKGQNWWCVMYPPLCLDVASTESTAVEGAIFTSESGYGIKFKLLEVAAILFDKQK